ncbi:XPG I-region family protein [Histomonas meleagridis]|uniref:XPG I-region family protein n=1 Tax=Histomonas meleagridis TaxID=135588 RepID=UPI00355A0557|nr:XPG I-region family protein [Histomonas meleagridis]KAH0802466.1 XPG I-region family protein [Histomonas meleagridis]
MGVQNLLPLLSSVSKRMNLSEFKGKRIAIDGFVWLHRSAISCAKQLVENPGTTRILSFCMRRLNQVLNCGLTPVVVFDGQSLPQKANTNAKRHQDREENKRKALELESLGRFTDAYTYYQRAVEITSLTVYTWIKQLRQFNIEYIVAPYEADAEMAYLARIGYVDIVLTEDSDLIAYQTPITLFKFDDNCMVTCIKFEDVLSHLHLTIDELLVVCCLSGCDYVEHHINRMGIQSAIKYVKIYSSKIDKLLSGIPSKYEVPENYAEEISNAVLTYKSQKVFDPRDKTLKNLEPIEGESPEFLGPDLANDLLIKLVNGEIDTRTLSPIVNENIGETSPYFVGRKDISGSQKIDQSMSRPLSPYFNKRKSESQKISSKSSDKITSYFDLMKK